MASESGNETWILKENECENESVNHHEDCIWVKHGVESENGCVYHHQNPHEL